MATEPWKGVLKYTLAQSPHVLWSFPYHDKQGNLDIVMVKVFMIDLAIPKIDLMD